MTKAKRSWRLAVSGVVLGAVCLGLAAAAAASDKPLWVRQLGTDGSDYASGVATDGAGNVYLTGVTGASLGGPNRGGSDAWVAKYDAAGHVLWKRQLGTDGLDEANGVATDAAGNVYLTGLTEGSLGGVHRGSLDAWVAKYDAAGHVLWKRQLGTETPDYASGVATDGAGNVYLTGGTWASLGGVYRGLYDAWVAKYDAAGHALWKRQLGTDGWDEASGAATDGAGNVYLTGYTSGSLGGPNRGESDAWVAKYDAAGQALWKRQLGTDGFDYASGVATDGAGNVYLTGMTYAPNRGEADAWVAKYDATGRLQWKRQLGTDGWDQAFGVATDAAGNVYLTGYTDGSLGGPNRGDHDVWVAKYSAD
ncbi:MAG: SBBP repeat-containing protein [Rhodospirillales bacterium]